MIFREATTEDIPQIQIVRHSVKENVLSDPSLVTDEDCRIYITERGKGWVCETDGKIVGFSIADLQENNIWALFVDHQYENRGIGKELHMMMMDWYFSTTERTVWLSTAPASRAETFYRMNGWKQTGITRSGEVRFEMTKKEWSSYIETLN